MCFQIRPQEMSETCFWVWANEEQYAKPELLTRVALTFCTQRTGELPRIFIYIYFILKVAVDNPCVIRSFFLNLKWNLEYGLVFPF